MIPPLIDRNCPPGEHLLFERLATDPSTEGWVVLHSLDIAQHVRQSQGEADFVIIAPRWGVAVVEVKSHRSVRRLPDGSWALGNQSPQSRSPFQQASSAMHSIRSYLGRKGIDLADVPIMSAVWFTHVQARKQLPSSPEWHTWQLLDRDDLREGVGKALIRTLSAGRKHLRDNPPHIEYAPEQPGARKVATLATALRPRFELATSPSDLRSARASVLSSFLEEQYDALDAMSEQHTVLFTGPAGSGKTFLALEACRRALAQHQAGALLCFNRGLADYLKSAAQKAGLRVSTLHRLMLDLTGLPIPSDATDAFWRVELPDAAAAHLLDNSEPYDFLVVDEIQDLCDPAYLDVLDLLVRGGLRGGRCLYFGDYERQAIYGTRDGRKTLGERTPGLVNYKLTTNCRNLPRIGHTVEFLANMSPGYGRFRRTDDGTPTRHLWYRDSVEQQRLLVQAARELRDEGYSAEEITILSTNQQSSAASQCADPWLTRQLAAEGTKPQANRIHWTTIHAFKGLESPAVILTDLDDPSRHDFAELLYIGLSRPTDRLTVLATRTAIGHQVLGPEGAQ